MPKFTSFLPSSILLGMVVGWIMESSSSSITLPSATRFHCQAAILLSSFELAAASALESSGLIRIVHLRDPTVYQPGFALSVESTSIFSIGRYVKHRGDSDAFDPLWRIRLPSSIVAAAVSIRGATRAPPSPSSHSILSLPACSFPTITFALFLIHNSESLIDNHIGNDYCGLVLAHRRWIITVGYVICFFGLVDERIRELGMGAGAEIRITVDTGCWFHHCISISSQLLRPYLASIPSSNPRDNNVQPILDSFPPRLLVYASPSNPRRSLDSDIVRGFRSSVDAKRTLVYPQLLDMCSFAQFYMPFPESQRIDGLTDIAPSAVDKSCRCDAIKELGRRRKQELVAVRRFRGRFYTREEGVYDKELRFEPSWVGRVKRVYDRGGYAPHQLCGA
ncbi:hypothetical protein C8J56DRAFT_1065146 [Mycena floridula]|nr:hypothetical protein C8J56DRAFT_1065146 [Mycena floridula]